MRPIDSDNPKPLTDSQSGPTGSTGDFGASMGQAQVKASLDQLGDALSDLNLKKDLASVEKAHARAEELHAALEHQPGYDKSKEVLSHFITHTQNPVSEQVSTYNELGANVVQTVQQEWSVAESNR